MRSRDTVMQLPLVLFLLFFSVAVKAEILSGKVVGISDGDTLRLLVAGNKQIKIRLAEIDTPEKAQPFGQRAKQALTDMVAGKNITVEVETIDKYGRTVGRVYRGDFDVNAELVKNGYAWVYRKYLHEKKLLQYEAEAKLARKGLWALPENERMPPWDWRHQHKDSRPTYLPIVHPPANASKCGNKHYCREMSSCEEAMFYLYNCGTATIDGDKNGFPCERMCGQNSSDKRSPNEKN